MKPPYAESTLRRKYRATGIENIGQVQEYLTACSNFYYIIEMEDVWKVIGGKCGVIREEFDSLLPIMARDGSLAFYIAPENEFYHDGTDDLLLINKVYLCVDDEEEGLVEDWDRFFAIDSQRRGKPLCIPVDLLAYADDDYYENTPQAQAMLRFLEQRRPAKEEQETKRKIAECTLVDMIDTINDVTIPMSKVLQVVLDEMEDFEYKHISKSELQHFMDLFTDLSNHTRMPSNRGFRPIEMLGNRKLGMPKQITFGPGMQGSIRNGELNGEEFKHMILSQSAWPTELKESMVAEIEKALRPGEEKWIGGTVYKGAKIGPNDPCPCGSGKKYKKCCGRKN